MLWKPSNEFIENSNLKRYENWLFEQKGLRFTDYQELHQWSIENLADFWKSLWHFFEIKSYSDYDFVLKKGDEMLKTQWFGGSKLNYSEHIFRNETEVRPAIIFKSETSEIQEISWKELRQKVAAIQQYLKEKNIQKGDRIAGYLANTADTIAIFLAANSLGAIWSCCSPDFGLDSVIDRFQQIEPKILFAHDSYSYNGKIFDKSLIINELSLKLNSLKDTVIINSEKWNSIIQNSHSSELTFTPVEFNHPIWILYSSGTTGKPKAITHSTGGNLIEHLKALSLHQNVKSGERYFWYSTTGWMMWNYSLSSLLCGATLCLYDGSPAYPDINCLWDFANQAQVNHFGSGAAFYIGCMKSSPSEASVAQPSPKRDGFLSMSEERNDIESPPLPSGRGWRGGAFVSIGSTGSPLPPEAFRWIYENISADAQLISLSGGTDVCSAFIGGCPYLPVYEGEMQCFTLGSAIEAWNDEGKSVQNEVGELIIKEPMPSMPVFFWNDTDNQRYRSSYFEKYPSVWCHGDWIKITDNQGVIIFGRSDATLNRDGVRIGTAEIYSAVESLPEVKDSLVVCIEKSDGSAFMPLYVVLDGELNEQIERNIKTILRTKYSPRHVPDAIFAVPEIPYTISGKKMEMPVKKILMGVPLEKAVTLDAMKNPESIRWFQMEKKV
jgi:acetoacetyl-CoA synthetase